MCFDGTYFVRGYNGSGLLGLGNYDMSIKDAVYKNQFAISLISKGADHVIVQTKDKKLYGVGKNTRNQLGIKGNCDKINEWGRD